jgi:hypothetical protein
MIWKIAAGVAALIGLLVAPIAVPSRPIVTTIDIAQSPEATFQYQAFQGQIILPSLMTREVATCR